MSHQMGIIQMNTSALHGMESVCNSGSQLWKIENVFNTFMPNSRELHFDVEIILSKFAS